MHWNDNVPLYVDGPLLKPIALLREDRAERARFRVNFLPNSAGSFAEFRRSPQQSRPDSAAERRFLLPGTHRALTMNPNGLETFPVELHFFDDVQNSVSLQDFCPCQLSRYCDAVWSRKFLCHLLMFVFVCLVPARQNMEAHRGYITLVLTIYCTV